MKRIFVLTAVGLLIVLAACKSNPDENAVRGIVVDFQNTLEQVIAGKAELDALDDYFATATEGANEQGLVNTREAFYKMLQEHVSGASRVQFSNFRITDVQVHQSDGLAKVTFQVDVMIAHGTEQGRATRTQDLALLKTARGWRISGGTPWRYSNVEGTLP